MELELNQHSTPFNLENTLQCGQLFRWEKHGDCWYGLVNQRVLKVRQENSVLEFKGASVDEVRKYFRLEDDLPEIITEICRDSLIRRAVQASPGLRIVRQEPWECLISYICATYKNIPAIRNMIFELSKRFGEEIVFDDYVFYTFPEAHTLVEASLDELRECGLGFRAKLVQETARIVEVSGVDFEMLKKVDYETAKGDLLCLPGVGNKVADCVLLFSLDKLEAFPIDVWMKRVVQNNYALHFDPLFIEKLSLKPSLSTKAYDEIGAFARGYFGEYAGYAQEYLFHYARNSSA